MDIIKYKSLTRTSLDKTDNLPHVGVYVIAYMGKVIYVGKASDSVSHRLQTHWYKRDVEMLGGWMDKLRHDWENIRLDVLEPPDEVNEMYWLSDIESQLIRKFKPLFNLQLMGQ